MNDLRYAIRQLWKHPGFTMVAVLTLALGIGANTAIFSVMDRLLARPLPVPNPEQLALVGIQYGEGQPDWHFNYPLFRDYQQRNTTFSHLTVIGDMSVGLGTGGATERQQAALVSGNYFSMLGVNAALGRTFAANEGVEIDDATVTVISHGLWNRTFGADPQVIGRTVTLNGKSFEIIGVAPREFSGVIRGDAPDLYVPITTFGLLSAEQPGGDHPLQTRYFTWLRIMGRMKPGLTLAQADGQMDILAQSVYAENPTNASTNLTVLPGVQGFTQGVQDVRKPLNLLLATAGLVLLIACANLANLQLARSTARSREFAIRLALGAGRVRVIRSLLSESLLLSVLGGLGGMAVAVWLTGAIEQFRPANSALNVAGGLDARVLLFALGVSVLTGVLFGLVPAWRASRPQLVPELKAVGGATEHNARWWNLRNGLVVAQVALSLLVLVGAGLCVRSLTKLQKVDPGFEPSRVVLMSFDLGLNNYSEAQTADFYARLLERVRTLPGIEAASLAMGTPLSGGTPGMSLERLEDYEPPPATDGGRPRPAWADFNSISEDYFRTLSIPVVQGREFTAADTAGSQKVALVDESFAQTYWPGKKDVVGKHLFRHNHNGDPTPIMVVGVVKSTRNRRLTETPRRMMYFPTTQSTSKNLTLTTRTGIDSAATIRMLREVAKDLDANVPVFRIRTLEQQKSESLALERMAATLLTGFGVLALLLAALGIYGVLAYSVSRRTREIGVRMALGAQINDVLRMVLRQGLGMVTVGLMVGVGGALAATRVLKGFLYETEPIDPLTFGVVIVLLTAVAVFACWLPARRAAKVNPMEALRTE